MTPRCSRGASARGGLALALAFAVALSPFAARAAPSGAPEEPELAEARARFEEGQGAYRRGEYREAIRAFKAAQAIRPSPVLDYNVGLAYEKLARPRLAVRYYRRYLEGQPDAENRTDVEAKVAALEARLEEAAEEEEAGEASPDERAGESRPALRLASSPAPAPPPAAPAEEPPIYTRWWFWVAVGAGALLVVAAATSRSGASSDDTASGGGDGAGSSPAPGAALLRF